MKNKNLWIIGTIVVIALIFFMSIGRETAILESPSEDNLYLAGRAGICRDTDALWIGDGKNYYEKGTTYSGQTTSSWEDECLDSTTLKEYFCNKEENRVYSIQKTRSGYVCFNGELTRDTEELCCCPYAEFMEPVAGKECALLGTGYYECSKYICTVGKCTDSDGGFKPKIWGKVKMGTTDIYGDNCEGGRLWETYCKDFNAAIDPVDCGDEYGAGWICEDGKCTTTTKTCSDTDATTTYKTGKNIYKKGRVTDQHGDLSPYDYCSDKTAVWEHWCSSTDYGYVAIQELHCPSGYECSNGACERTAVTPTSCTNPTASAGKYYCDLGYVYECDPSSGSANSDGWKGSGICGSGDLSSYVGQCVTNRAVVSSRTDLCRTTAGTASCSASGDHPSAIHGTFHCVNNKIYQCEDGTWNLYKSCSDYGTGYVCAFATSYTTTNIGSLCKSTTQPITGAKVESISTTVQIDGAKIKAQIVLKNTGTVTADDFLIEIQAIAGTCIIQPQAIISDVKTCDPSHTQNIHRTVFGLSAGEQITLDFETPGLSSGSYCVKVLSVDKCCPDNPCNGISPFYFGKELKTVQITSTVMDKCGDGKCTGKEHYGNCPQDCTSWCGDTYCNPATESAEEGVSGKLYCPTDCKPVVPVVPVIPVKIKPIWIILGAIAVIWLFFSKKGRRLMFKK